MSNPARCRRKAKLTDTRRSARLSPTLRTTSQPRTASAASSATWNTIRRTVAFRQGSAMRGRSADRQRVLEAALVPEVVQAARKAERLRAEELVIDLAVIADRLDRVERPRIVEAELSAEIALEPEEAAHRRVLGVAALDLIDIGLGDPKFLGGQQDVVHPLQDVRPLVVALAGVDAQRLLRDHVRQDRPIARVLHRRAGRGDRAGIVRVAVAATGLGGSEGLLRLLEQQGL